MACEQSPYSWWFFTILGLAGFSGGFVGVDVFFVISGYLMTAIIITSENDRRLSLVKFYLSRARRIVPALAVLCAVMLLFGWFVLAPIDYANLSKEVYSSLGYYSNMVYLLEAGYFDVASHEKWLLHTWSLSVEWQFYLLYPLYILLALRLLQKCCAYRSCHLGGILWLVGVVGVCDVAEADRGFLFFADSCLGDVSWRTGFHRSGQDQAVEIEFGVPGTAWHLSNFFLRCRI